MSLYHETAEVLRTLNTAPGSLKNRIFKNKTLKSPPAQVYALAIETAKWSEILTEIINSTGLLKAERKLTPLLALLLTHDFLLAKSGISLPASHGLRIAVEHHKSRLASAFTLLRVKRRCPDLAAFRNQVEVAARSEDAGNPRWIRVNTILSDVSTELETTFKNFKVVSTIKEVMESKSSEAIHVDVHVPNLLAASPGTDITKTDSYRNGRIILQDKASCFPAYLLDARIEDGDIIDGCAAPGNKTTHAAAILCERQAAGMKGDGLGRKRIVYAFEKSKFRSEILKKMVTMAGAKDIVKIAFAEDFLRTKPREMGHVGSLLLDPSCSGSGIVGRDSNLTLYVPDAVGAQGKKNLPTDKKERKNMMRDKKKAAATAAVERGNVDRKESVKRKRGEEEDDERDAQRTLLDNDGNEILTAGSIQELNVRLRALATFQTKIVLHALEFPGARRVTYSTCSVHAEENEHVVLAILASDIARRRGWRILRREEQARGMREWPVRGVLDMARGDEEVAEGCIRSYKGDGRGVMGFFVAGFVREGDDKEGDGDVPDVDEIYVRGDDGRIVRKEGTGMPLRKDTGEFVQVTEIEEDDYDDSDNNSDDIDDGSSSASDDSGEGGSGEEWGGFDD